MSRIAKYPRSLKKPSSLLRNGHGHLECFELIDDLSRSMTTRPSYCPFCSYTRAVTTDCAFKAMELAQTIDNEITDVCKSEGSLLEKRTLDSAAIPVATKVDLKAKVSQLEAQVKKTKKKIGEENIQRAVMAAMNSAEVAACGGKQFYIVRVDVGLDTTAVREAALKAMYQKGLAVMVFSADEASDKAVVYAGVPNNGSKDGLVVMEWLNAAMGPLKGWSRGHGVVDLLCLNSYEDWGVDELIVEDSFIVEDS